MIRQIRCLGQWDQLRAKLCHTLLHSLLHNPVSLRCKEAAVVDSLTILKEFFESPDFASQFQNLGDTSISKASCGALGPIDRELEVFKVSARHSDFSLVEELIILDLRGGFGCSVVAQS